MNNILRLFYKGLYLALRDPLRHCGGQNPPPPSAVPMSICDLISLRPKLVFLLGGRSGILLPVA